MATILLIDDHPIVLTGLKNLLTSKFHYDILTADTTDKAMETALSHPEIDLLVCDLSLDKSSDGLELIERLRSRGFNRPTVVYTMHEEMWNIVNIEKTKVEGVVLKGDDVGELLKAVETVLADGKYVSPSFERQRMTALQGTAGLLSTTDISVLERIANGENNQEISEALHLSIKSIEYHRSNIIKKLSVRNINEAIAKAFTLDIL